MRPSMWQIVVIVLIIVLLVGYKRLPDMARSVGRSLRIFKSEVEQLTDKDDEPDDDTTDQDRSRRSGASPSRLESGPERRDDDNEPRRG